MRRMFGLLLLGLLTSPALPAWAEGPSVDLPSAIRRAERVVVAAVVAVEPAWQTNKWGDRLIVSRTRVRATEILKGGPASGDLAVDMAGGTLGGLTLKVSHAPLVSPGDRAVFLLKRGENGVLVPTDHGAGVMKLTKDNRVTGSHLRLEDVRRAATAAR